MLAITAPSVWLASLWDSSALRRALSYGEVRGERVRALSRAADVRVAAAIELGADHDVPALALLRDALVLRVAAALAATDATADVHDLTPESAWDALDALGADATGAPMPPATRARAALSSSSLVSLDDLAEADRRVTRAQAEAIDLWLRGFVEPRAPAVIRADRASRVAVLVVVVAAVALLIVRSLSTEANVALGRSVEASSRYPGTSEPSGLTDGVRTGAHGAHTNRERSAWLAIDLGTTRRVRRVAIYNRGDGYESEVVPLVLEVSVDGSRYHRLGERKEPFTQAEPWVVEVTATEARWVRVRRPKAGYIALSEIEVFE